MRILILPFVALATIATPAVAQDQRFPGFRVEANVGWDSARGSLDYEDAAFPADNFTLKDHSNGALFGGTVGYDLPVGDGQYVGIEASYDIADNKRCEEVFGSDEACLSIKRNWSIGGRFGTRVARTVLCYVGGAYIDGRARVSYEDQIDPTNNFSEAENRKGWQLSAGFEHRLVGNTFVTGEYRYNDYKNYKLTDGTESLSLGFSRHQVVAGVGMRF